MKTHATFPYCEYFKGIGEIVSRFVEKDLSQATAEDHPYHTVEQQIIELLVADQRLLLESIAPKQDELDEGEQVHQTIPADGNRADGNCDGVKLGMQQH